MDQEWLFIVFSLIYIHFNVFKLDCVKRDALVLEMLVYLKARNNAKKNPNPDYWTMQQPHCSPSTHPKHHPRDAANNITWVQQIMWIHETSKDSRHTYTCLCLELGSLMRHLKLFCISKVKAVLITCHTSPLPHGSWEHWDLKCSLSHSYLRGNWYITGAAQGSCWGCPEPGTEVG